MPSNTIVNNDANKIVFKKTHTFNIYYLLERVEAIKTIFFKLRNATWSAELNRNGIAWIQKQGPMFPSYIVYR